jgi:hypothetical protein
MHQYHWSLKDLLNYARRTYEDVLAFEERHRAVGLEVCKVLCRIISERGQLRKFPRKSSRWDLYPEPDRVTSVR